MGRTTDEWAELLNGTTEGPWNVSGGWIYGPRYAQVLVAETARRGSGCMSYEVPVLVGECIYRDLPLAAAAPDAVAEVIRLRREIKDMLRAWRIKEAVSVELRDSAQHPQKAVHARFLKSHQHVTRRLTRILEGDTDDRP